jgi:hypothetical protein
MLLTPLWDFYMDSGAIRIGKKRRGLLKNASGYFFTRVKPTFEERNSNFLYIL